VEPAAAASPAYCALYAREYATARIGAPVTNEDAGALQRVEDQAYYRCLNQDEAPQFPTTSAYFGAPLEGLTSDRTEADGPFQALQIHPTSKTPGTTQPSQALAAPAATAPTDSASGGAPRQQVADNATWTRHGVPGSPEWVGWCKSHYRSFDEATGRVLTLSGVKKLCP
jgi:hypothetical protein